MDVTDFLASFAVSSFSLVYKRRTRKGELIDEMGTQSYRP